MTPDLLTQLESVASSGYQPVSVGDLAVEMRPITLMECLRVLRRFPSLKSALFGGADETTLLDVLLDAGPEAVAALVVISTGHGGDKRHEEVVAALPDDVLIPMVTKVIELTMPEGVEAFFGRLTALAGAAGMTAAPAKPAAGKRIRMAHSPQTRS